MSRETINLDPPSLPVPEFEETGRSGRVGHCIELGHREYHSPSVGVSSVGLSSQARSPNHCTVCSTRPVAPTDIFTRPCCRTMLRARAKQRVTDTGCVLRTIRGPSDSSGRSMMQSTPAAAGHLLLRSAACHRLPTAHHLVDTPCHPAADTTDRPNGQEPFRGAGSLLVPWHKVRMPGMLVSP